MNTYLRNEKGLTLAELLAVFAIGSLIMIMITSVFILIQKQYITQSDTIEQLTDVTIVAKEITKGIRSAEEVRVPNEHEIQVTVDGERTTYSFVDQMLQKDGNSYVDNVASFEVEEENNTISISIESTSGKTLTTNIAIREGDHEEDEKE